MLSSIYKKGWRAEMEGKLQLRLAAETRRSKHAPSRAAMLYKRKHIQCSQACSIIALFCSRCRHDTSTKELANCPKFISTSLQCILKHIVPVRRVLLRFSERTNIVVCRSTFWTLSFHTVCFIEATLVKRVLA